jgi:hypothetical protein
MWDARCDNSSQRSRARMSWTVILFFRASAEDLLWELPGAWEAFGEMRLLQFSPRKHSVSVTLVITTLCQITPLCHDMYSEIVPQIATVTSNQWLTTCCHHGWNLIREIRAPSEVYSRQRYLLDHAIGDLSKMTAGITDRMNELRSANLRQIIERHSLNRQLSDRMWKILAISINKSPHHLLFKCRPVTTFWLPLMTYRWRWSRRWCWERISILTSFHNNR